MMKISLKIFVFEHSSFCQKSHKQKNFQLSIFNSQFVNMFLCSFVKIKFLRISVVSA